MLTWKRCLFALAIVSLSVVSLGAGSGVGLARDTESNPANNGAAAHRPELHLLVPRSPGAQAKGDPAGETTRGGVAQAARSQAAGAVVTFGTDVRVSADNPGQLHYDPWGAANPSDPAHFIIGANDDTANGSSYTGFWYSTNAGQTWTGGNLAGPYPGGEGIVPGGSASVDIDALGNSYLTDLGFNNLELCAGGVYAHRSTNGGATFGAPVQVAASDNNHFLYRPAMAVNRQTGSPSAGRVYVTYSNLNIGVNCNFTGFTGSVAYLSYSSDQGTTWSTPGMLPQPSSPAYNSVVGDVTVSSNDTLHVAYNWQWTGNDQRNYVTRSTDGGQTFSPHNSVTSAVIERIGYSDSSGAQFIKGDNAGHGLHIGQLPSIEAAPGDPNILYTVWAHHQSGWDTTYTANCCGGGPTSRTFRASDIAFARSTDGGQTWGAPVRLNDDAQNNGKDQFLPWLAVSPDGTVHVSWLDRRDSADNTLYHVYYTQSTDGGQTWSANTKVSDAASNPASALGTDNNATLGDHSSLAAGASRVLPIWTDVRAGTPAGEQRIYTDPGQVAGCAISFADVPTSAPFYTFIKCLACRQIIGGYPCGGPGEQCNSNDDPYFRPGVNVTRGQISKMVALAANLSGPTGEQIFQDVPPNSTFYDPIQQLASRGYIGGYPCGTSDEEQCVGQEPRPYFRPGHNTTRGQLSKIVSETAQFNDDPGAQKFTDVAPGSPFYVWINRLVNRQIISGYPCGTEGAGEPCDAQNRPYFRPGALVTRGQTAKIVANTFFPDCETPARR